jgi:hypothetical protein
MVLNFIKLSHFIKTAIFLYLSNIIYWFVYFFNRNKQLVFSNNR